MLVHFRPAICLLSLLTALTGIAYPALVTVVAQGFSPETANGSLLRRDGVVVGSRLIAQSFEGPGYLHPRPSAGGYATLPSAASNLAPTNAALLKTVAARVAAYRAANDAFPPIDAVTTSGSGLDPDISPQNAFDQAGRIAKTRQVPENRVLSILRAQVRGRWLDLFGEPRVNVLVANLALDAALPKGTLAAKR